MEEMGFLGCAAFLCGHEWYFGLDGLETHFNVMNQDYYFFWAAKIRLRLGRVTTFEHVVADMAKVPVCSMFTANEYNAYGDCPADGRYSYSTTYQLPAPSSDFMSWASTGYAGDIAMDVYYHANLVGRCVVGIKTMVTGSYEKKSYKSKPSGEIAAIVVLSLTALVAMYILCLCFRPCWSKQAEIRRTRIQDATALNYYVRMQAPNVDKASITPSTTTTTPPKIESRYSAKGSLKIID